MIRVAIKIFFAMLAVPAYAIDIQEVMSRGGIKAWLVEDHSIPLTAITLEFKGGASLDAPGKRGAINMMTSLLEEGAGKFNATSFAQTRDKLGADFSFSVSNDTLSVSLFTLTKNRDEVADLLATAMTHPRFDNDAVVRVRRQIQADIKSQNTDPQAIAFDELNKQTWGGHPYGSSAYGTVESVAKLSRGDLVIAKNRVLARDRIIVGAAGDITPDELGKLLDRILGGLSEKGAAPLPESAMLQLTGGVTVIDNAGPQTIVCFAGPGLPLDDPGYVAANVANQILGGSGFSSRLMAEIREKRGLTYGVWTELISNLYGHRWEGTTAISNANVAKGIDLIHQEWDRMAQGGVTEKELTDAKTYLSGTYPLQFDGNVNIAWMLADMQLSGFPIDYPKIYSAKVGAVTAQDVQDVAKRLLKSENLRFVLVGHPDSISDNDEAKTFKETE